MKPTEAQQLLDGINPAPWDVNTQTYENDKGAEFAEFWVTAHNECQVTEQDVSEQHREKTAKDFALIAAAPDMAAMIAGMTIEYAIMCKPFPDAEWRQVTQWSDKNPLNDGYDLFNNECVIARYVTSPHVLGEEQ